MNTDALEKINSWQATYPNSALTYDNLCRLCEVDTLDNLDLSGFNLQRLDLQGENCTGINFTNATLHKSRFDDSVFKQCIFNHTNMTEISASRAVFDDETFYSVDLSNLYAPSASFCGALFKDSIMRGAYMMYSQCRSTIFSTVDFWRAQLDYIDATDAIFQNVSLYELEGHAVEYRELDFI